MPSTAMPLFAAELRSAADLQSGGPVVIDPDDVPATGNTSSAYVPVDSWIYPVFDRLMAMGYAPSGSMVLRPWTRTECARLLAEAHRDISSHDETAVMLAAELDREFAYETSVLAGARGNRTVQLDSVYARYTQISGTALRDGFHFGQTITDDFGRPYGQGANANSGLSLYGASGRFSFYARGEHQYASAMPTTMYTAAVQQAIVNYDDTVASTQGTIPFGWNLRYGTTDRVRLVEAYVSATAGNWQLSFGQQSLWWSPDRTTSLLLSNNAEAMPMLRLTRVKPVKMPDWLLWMGPVHFDAFFARQGGIHYVGLGPTFALYGSQDHALTPPPYLWGVAFTSKPTQNFEIGFAHTVIFAGYGRPLNFSTFFHSFSINGNGQAVDPGKRVTEFNLSYRVPGLRKYLEAYTEGMAWDDPVEGKFVARFAMDPGIYIPRVPGVKKLDLRAEGVYTDLPKLQEPAYFYSNAHYPQGYTNYGQIMGSWIGRQGRGGNATATYWFTPRNTLAFSYRKMTVDKSMLQGGNMEDVSGSLNWLVRKDIALSATGQFEQWRFSLLSPAKQTNFSTILSVTFHPGSQR